MNGHSLIRLGTDARATILRVNSEFAVRERLAALGLKPGRRVQVIRRIGTTGPLQLRVDHTDLVVRAADAALIEVEVTK